MPVPKLYPEEVAAKFPPGTFEAIRSVLRANETRAEFIRSMVANGIERRRVEAVNGETADHSLDGPAAHPETSSDGQAPRDASLAPCADHGGVEPSTAESAFRDDLSEITWRALGRRAGPDVLGAMLIRMGLELMKSQTGSEDDSAVMDRALAAALTELPNQGSVQGDRGSTPATLAIGLRRGDQTSDRDASKGAATPKLP